MYQQFIKPLLFSLNPETAHHLAMLAGKACKKTHMLPIIEKIFRQEDPRLEQEIFGLKFKNPVGLAAGSDKSCQAQEFFSALGFGFLESVSFAYQAQPGNPKPRIFRLKEDSAIINRLGFPSPGAPALVPRIKEALKYVKKNKTVFAVNFAKSKDVPLESAVDDYLKSFRLMKDLADYIVINVSSPNTPGLRTLQEATRLNEILQAVQEENKNNLPLLVKVAPDLNLNELDDIIECASANRLQGIVATNTTKSREGLKTEIDQEGGLSGRPLFRKSVEFVRHIRKQSKGHLKIIGVGGISDANDTIQMLKAGADLTELYTAMVYQGPSIAYNIKQGLIEFIEKNKLKNISEIIGTDIQ